jgi:hypothetical protein
MPSRPTLFDKPAVRFAARTCYYLAIQLGLVYLSAHQALVTAPFIYQGF